MIKVSNQLLRSIFGGVPFFFFACGAILPWTLLSTPAPEDCIFWRKLPGPCRGRKGRMDAHKVARGRGRAIPGVFVLHNDMSVHATLSRHMFESLPLRRSVCRSVGRSVGPSIRPYAVVIHHPSSIIHHSSFTIHH